MGGILLWCVGGTTLEAQTRFQSTDSAPDYTRYRTVEDCLAATGRLNASALAKSPRLLDTMEFTQSEPWDSLSPDAIAFARRCSAQFRPETDSLGAYLDWIRLYLNANRDDAAQTIVTRKLAGARWNPTDTFGGREAVLRNILSVYLQAKPMRWSNVLTISTQFEAPDSRLDPFALLRIYATIFDIADEINDSVIQFQISNKVLAVANTLTSEQKASSPYQTAQYTVVRALDFLSHHAILDSLRRGPRAYVALKRANWTKAHGDSSDQMGGYIGERAQPLVAEFWFSDSVTQIATGDTSGTPPPLRPTPGKVSLILFLGGCREYGYAVGAFPGATGLSLGGCWNTYAAVHRLMKRYPTIELTIASQTNGYLGDAGPLTPQEEARVMQSWWLGFHRIPGVLAVANTEFFRLGGYDRRRINQLTPNHEHYSFGAQAPVSSTLAYLIDTEGTVLFSAPLGRLTERVYRELLDAIMKR